MNNQKQLPESESYSVMSDYLQPHGLYRILQARILEWVAFPFSRGSSQLRDQTRSPALQADSLPAEPQGKPKNTGVGSHSLLQRIFPTQVSNPGLLHCRQILYQLNLQGSPNTSELIYKMETDSQTWKTIHGSNLWLPKVEGRRRIN